MHSVVNTPLSARRFEGFAEKVTKKPAVFAACPGAATFAELSRESSANRLEPPRGKEQINWLQARP